MTQWTEEDPGAGDLVGLHVFRSTLELQREQAKNAIDVIKAAMGQVHSCWTGPAAGEWQAQAALLITGFSLRHGAADHGAAATGRYTAEVEDIKRITEDLHARQKKAKAGLAAVEDERAKYADAMADPAQNKVRCAEFADLRHRWSQEEGEHNDTLDLVSRELKDLATRRDTADRSHSSAITDMNDVLASAHPLTAMGAPAMVATGGDSVDSQIAAAIDKSNRFPGSLPKLDGKSAKWVNAWWLGLNAETRMICLNEQSAIIGNCEGIPYVDRDTANVLHLRELYEAAKAKDPGSAEARAYKELMDMFYGPDGEPKNKEGMQNKDSSGSPTAPPLYLITLRDRGGETPYVSVSAGNLDTSTYTTFFIPGMSTTSEHVRSGVDAAKAIWDADREHSAVVFCIDFEEPITPNETSEDSFARRGGERLAAMLEGFNDVRGDESRVNVVGLSYGTTIAAYALASGDYGVDSFVMLGSAGIPYSITIDDLHVPVDEVYATEAPNDWQADVGRGWGLERADPTSADWGAFVFESDGDRRRNLDATGEHSALGTEDLPGYLRPGTESLDAVHNIVTGKGKRVHTN